MGRQSGGIRGGFRPRAYNASVPPAAIPASSATTVKTRSKIFRDYYTAQMSPLLKQNVSTNGNGHTISVGFTKEGNKHLFNDAYSHKTALQPSDLPHINEILRRSVFVKKSKIYKKRKDKIKRFYYYKTTLHGSTVYLNVAETDMLKNGHWAHDRYLYAVTKRLK